MTAVLQGIFENLIAGLIGAALGYAFKLLLDNWRQRKRYSNIVSFFGLKGNKVYIIHSAVLDQSRSAYNFPSCDTRAARIVAHLLELTGRIEERDFIIAPENNFIMKDGSIDGRVWQNDVIFLCGPKRNTMLSQALGKSPQLRYTMEKDERTGENRLFDNGRKSEILSSRDMGDKNPSSLTSGYDFGLILSMPCPMNIDRTMVVLAGIHGAGTLGAAVLVSDPDKLSSLCRRRHNGVIQEVVSATYIDDLEHVVEVSLV